MNNLFSKRKGLLLFMLYVCPLCVFLQCLFFATSNVYAACYITLTSCMLLKSGLRRRNEVPLILGLFLTVMLILVSYAGDLLSVMQTLLLIFFLYSKTSQDLFGVKMLSTIILIVGVICAISCIIEVLNFPLYAAVILPYFKTEAADAMQKLLLNGGMCGIMPQTSHAAGVILNAFYVLIILNSSSISKKWRILLSILLIVGLFLTAKRAHLFFGIAVWLSSYIIISSNRKRAKNFLVIAVVVAVSIPILTSVASKLGENNVLSEIVFSFQNISSDKEDVMHGRDYLYEMAWKKIEKDPFIGQGWGSFKKTVDYHGGATDVHNVYLQLWAECGIGVLILYVIMLLSLIIKTVRLTRFYGTLGEKYKIVVDSLRFSFCVQGFFIMYCFTGNCLYNIDFFSMYILAVSIMLAANKKSSLITINI